MEKEKPNYYAVIPANVRYDERLRANEKLLYGEITCLCNKNGECWASNNYFAKLYGVTAQAVSKWILNLVENGYITTEFTYKENTTVVEKRSIKLVSTNVDSLSTKIDKVSTNVDNPINKCFKGYQQKFKENNINNNITSINRQIDFNLYKDNEEIQNLFKKCEIYLDKATFQFASEDTINRFRMFQRVVAGLYEEAPEIAETLTYDELVKTYIKTVKYSPNDEAVYMQKCLKQNYFRKAA